MRGYSILDGTGGHELVEVRLGGEGLFVSAEHDGVDRAVLAQLLEAVASAWRVDVLRAFRPSGRLFWPGAAPTSDRSRRTSLPLSVVVRLAFPSFGFTIRY